MFIANFFCKFCFLQYQYFLILIIKPTLAICLINNLQLHIFVKFKTKNSISILKELYFIYIKNTINTNKNFCTNVDLLVFQ